MTAATPALLEAIRDAGGAGPATLLSARSESRRARRAHRRRARATCIWRESTCSRLALPLIDEAAGRRCHGSGLAPPRSDGRDRGGAPRRRLPRDHPLDASAPHLEPLARATCRIGWPTWGYRSRRSRQSSRPAPPPSKHAQPSETSVSSAFRRASGCRYDTGRMRRLALIPLLTLAWLQGAGGSNHGSTYGPAPGTSTQPSVSTASTNASRTTTALRPGRAAGRGERCRRGRHPRQPGLPRLPQRPRRLLDEVPGGLGAARLRRRRSPSGTRTTSSASSSASGAPRRRPQVTARARAARTEPTSQSGAPQRDRRCRAAARSRSCTRPRARRTR